ncbi:MAG: response regulator [Spirochaetes bacterium]|nr:response regulator [Spirochaetota bacterium]
MSSTPHILIIDDDETISLLQIHLLEKAGYSVDRAGTGAIGLERLRNEKIDILLLDLMLPDTDGLTILKSLPQLRLEATPDIIVLSALDDPQTTFECLRAGAYDFIRKPFYHEEYLLRINNLAQLRNFRSMTQLLQEKMEGDLKRLSRYFSKDLIQSIVSGEVSADSGGEIVRCTCMMFDLRGSTSLAEEMGPSKFFNFITEFFSDLSDLIFNNGGSINKFTGDGFLVTFGLRSYSEQATYDAIDCAFKIREHVALFNQLSNPDIKNGIRFGIGITTGDVFAGNIGNVHRLEYTILGDPVNLSARLESLTKNAKVDILIDGTTRAVLGDKLRARKLKIDSVRGKKETVDIYFPVAFSGG